MAEVGVLAYPVILATMYGVYRIGRQQTWGGFEYMRLGTLAILLGLLIAVQVKLVMLGLVRGPFTLASALVSVFGMGLLVGLYIWDTWAKQRRALRIVAVRTSNAGARRA